MKNVKLEDFKIPVIHKHVTDIVFRGTSNGGKFRFDLGFLPESEFIYHFDISPDVYFHNLSIKEIYYEPYRTFLRMKSPVDIEIHWPGISDKLYVKGLEN